ncbi:MAG: UbiA family prenyltransferase [Actinobacteria bacterium]|nr:UbiA family prenyltransferase [Actinomycetota bacterium]
MGAGLALAAGHGAAVAAGVGLAVLAGQLSVGWANDWLDWRRDRSAGRTDKPTVAGTVAVATLRRAALGSLAACVPLSLALGMRAGTFHLLAVAVAWAYDLGLKLTPLSVGPYAVSFGLLPVFALLAGPSPAAPPGWLPLSCALLGAGAHFANALPDLGVDARTGVRGLPQRLGRRGSSVAAAALTGAGALAVGAGAAPGRPVVAAGVGASLALAGALLVAALRGPPRVAFRLSIATSALLLATVLVGATGLGSAASGP